MKSQDDNRSRLELGALCKPNEFGVKSQSEPSAFLQLLIPNGKLLPSFATSFALQSHFPLLSLSLFLSDSVSTIHRHKKNKKKKIIKNRKNLKQYTEIPVTISLSVYIMLRGTLFKNKI